MGMPSTLNGKFVVGYIFFVGVPLLGLLGVLHLGQRLTAPTSVEGVWEVKTDPTPGQGVCAGSLASGRKVSLAISQSGKNLSVSQLDEPINSVDGVIEGEMVTIASLRVPTDNKCSNDQIFSLAATLDTAHNPSGMSGELSVKGCSSCSPLRFTAAKRSFNEPRGRW